MRNVWKTISFSFSGIKSALVLDFFQFFSKGFRPLGGANLTLAQRLDDNMEMIFTLLSIFVGGVMQIGLNYQRQNICHSYGFFTTVSPLSSCLAKV